MWSSSTVHLTMYMPADMNTRKYKNSENPSKKD